MSLWVSALFSGVVAIAVTRAVERFGGILGGLLGTMPTTIVPASLGIWAGSATVGHFHAAMGFVPVGMLIDAGFLWLWRAVPPRLPAGNLHARLGAMVIVSLGAWGLAAALVMAGADAVVGAGIPVLGIGVGALAAGLFVGVVSARASVPAPRGTRPVTWMALAMRGVLAAAAIGVSVALAQSGIPVLAGIASVFPAIFVTTMAGLWLAQGEAVPTGAVGPMMLGATSVSAYALFAAVLFPGIGPAAGSVVAWLLAVVAVTWPATRWLTRRGADGT